MGQYYARVHITDVMTRTSINVRLYDLEPDEASMGAPVAQAFCTVEIAHDDGPIAYLRDALVAAIEHL